MDIATMEDKITKTEERHSHQSTKPYKRQNKPPLSYIALIAMAINDSPSRQATLAEINEYLMKKFEFFRGPYTGWRNSIRHNLSLNECFIKVLRDPNRPWGKDNYWIINPNSEYTFANGVFSRRRKRLIKTMCHSPNNQRLMEEEIYFRTKRSQKTCKNASKPQDIHHQKSSLFTIDNILKPVTKNATASSQERLESNEPCNVLMDSSTSIPISTRGYQTSSASISNSNIQTLAGKPCCSSESAQATSPPASRTSPPSTSEAHLHTPSQAALSSIYSLNNRPIYPVDNVNVSHWMNYSNAFWSYYYLALLQSTSSHMLNGKDK